MRDRDARSGGVERLKRRSDFQAMAAGLRTAGRGFVLQARPRVEGGAARVGFTVSRQVGNAVERNRVRRRLREIVRISAGATLRSGHDYVLIGRRAALSAPFDEMVRDLDAALSRVHGQGRALPAGTAGGTGAAPSGALHEAGSPSRLPQRRRNRTKPPKPTAKPISPSPHER